MFTLLYRQGEQGQLVRSFQFEFWVIDVIRNIRTDSSGRVITRSSSNKFFFAAPRCMVICQQIDNTCSCHSYCRSPCILA